MARLNAFRNQRPDRRERIYMILSGLFLGALVMTNAIAGKFFVLFGQPLSCGILAYPVTFLVTDLVSELYGHKRANQLVWTGFAVSVFVTLIVILANVVPIYDQSPVSEGAFNEVFGLLPGIVFGSMCAYLFAQFIDVRLFEFWRQLTNGKHLWLRNNASTIFSQIVDTVLVVLIALVIWPNIDGNDATTAITWPVFWSIVIGQYLFKAAIALLDTPLVYLLKWRLMKYLRL